jgi:leucyl aminopeptidase
MQTSATTAHAAETDADTVVVGVIAGEKIPHDVDGVLQELVDSGEARSKHKHLAVGRAGDKRWILVGLGERDDLTAERLRIAAAVAAGRAGELGTRRLCWELPHRFEDHPARAVVEGTLLAAYRFDRFKSGANDDAGPRLEALVVSDHDDRADAVAAAAVVAEAVNGARDLQNTPANVLTPTALAAHARGIEGLTCEIEGRDGIVAKGMGAFAAVAQGSHQEPALITLRYEPADARGPVLGLVGKAVTFDSGGISIKPGAKMGEMKFDMSGGAAVVEAMRAIARLQLPVRVVAVVGATENLPSGHAMKPGDIVTAMNGTTIEIDNTDAEGRLVLADCLAHALSLGAERLVDVATLTGAIVVALGSTHSGLMSNDDAWAGAVLDAAATAGEPAWRLPLHDEYEELIRGKYADINNTVESRKAGSITAAHFLRHFAGDTPWAHLDIAGTAWDGGKPYAPKGGSGIAVRTLVQLARDVCA